MRWLHSMALVLALSAAALAGAVEDAIKDLGSDDFQKREAATAKLSEAGPEAIPLLEKAAKDPDPEVRWRAEKALQAVRARAGKPPAPAASKPGDDRAAPPPPPPQPGGPLEGARQRFGRIQEELDRVRPGFRDLLKGFGQFDPDFQKILEEMERSFADLARPDRGGQPFGQDFWSFRFKDGKWELVRPQAALAAKLGIRTQPTAPALKAHLKLADGEEGIVLEEVLPGGLAATAFGLRQWDVLLTIDGRPVTSEGDLELMAKDGNHTVALIREGERREISFAGCSIDRFPPKPEVESAPEPEEAPAPPPKRTPKKDELKKY